jgi:hypothetical protein
VRRDTKEVLAELVEKLKEKLDPKVAATSAGEKHPRGELRPNLEPKPWVLGRIGAVIGDCPSPLVRRTDIRARVAVRRVYKGVNSVS